MVVKEGSLTLFGVVDYAEVVIERLELTSSVDGIEYLVLACG